MRIVSNDDDAKLLFDPMRKEILRLLSIEEYSEAGLANVLGLRPPTVGHHLDCLRKSGMVRIVKTVVEEHGIVQKFYRASAATYVIDTAMLSPTMRRYSVPLCIERTRGIIAALGFDGNGDYPVSSRIVEKLTEEFATSLVEVARSSQGPFFGEDPEQFVNMLYGKALANVLRSRREVSSQVPQVVKGQTVLSS